MTFPYPKNPSDWQTTYTRNHAYSDSAKYQSRFTTPILIGTLIALIYAAIYAFRFIFPRMCNPSIDDWWNDSSLLCTTRFLTVFIQGTSSPNLRWSVAILTVLSCFLFPIVIQNASLYPAIRLFIEFYHPPYGTNPSKIINYRLSGISKLPPPLDLLFQFKYILVKDGDIDKKDEWPAWCARNLGGPFMMIVFDGNALYLERGNRFSRVVGPGDKIPFLEWHETIKYIVDLRPKIKEDSFNVWTKDGINIKLTVQVECRIGDPTQNDPSAKLVYPYDPVAVKKAVERYALRWPERIKGEPSEFTWLDAAWGQVTGITPSYIGSRMIDDLFIATRDGGQILSRLAMKEIFDKINNATKLFGVYVTDFQILKIEMPEEVHEHQREYWKAERQGTSTIIDGKARAYSIRTHEKARADTQRDLIMAIAEGLEKNNDGHFSESLLLALSGALDKSLKDPLTRAYLARETLETLEQIQKMLDLDKNNGI